MLFSHCICVFKILYSFSVLLVYFSESINKLASTNWKIFSRQQYFDSNGLFISVVFSIPILFNCMLMVVSNNLLIFTTKKDFLFLNFFPFTLRFNLWTINYVRKQAFSLFKISNKLLWSDAENGREDFCHFWLLLDTYWTPVTMLFTCCLFTTFNTNSAAIKFHSTALVTWDNYKFIKLILDVNGCGAQILIQWFFHCNLFIFQGSWLYQSTQLMRNLKMAQLKEQMKKDKENRQRLKSKDEWLSENCIDPTSIILLNFFTYHFNF